MDVLVYLQKFKVVQNNRPFLKKKKKKKKEVDKAIKNFFS